MYKRGSALRFSHASFGSCSGTPNQKTLKTLTSLNEEARPFFSRRQQHLGFLLFLPLAITAFGGAEGDFSLAIIAFGAFEFIVPKYWSRLDKNRQEESRLLNLRRLRSSRKVDSRAGSRKRGVFLECLGKTSIFTQPPLIRENPRFCELCLFFFQENNTPSKFRHVRPCFTNPLANPPFWLGGQETVREGNKNKEENVP